MTAPIQQSVFRKHTVSTTRCQRLVLHSAVAAALVSGGYSREAYAGSCQGFRVSICRGAENVDIDTTQKLIESVLTVRTTAGFGIDTTVSGGDAFLVAGYDGLTFLDDHSSVITGRDHGIYAFTKGNGALSITSSGVVTGIESHGIFATSAGNYNLDTTIQTGAVAGGSTGIFVRSGGVGSLRITSNGSVTGRVGDGISADNDGSGAAGLSLTTAAVAGGWRGIAADNDSGALNITSSDTVKGAGSDGVFALNAGTDLIVQTATVYGYASGIRVRNYGSGALQVTSTGTVTGTVDDGIRAFNSTRSKGMTVQTAAIRGADSGIDAWNFGSGDLNIVNTDSVIASSTYGTGIYARNYGADLTLQTSEVTGGGRGIVATNKGSGALSITTSGDVTGGDANTPRAYGIIARNSRYGTGLTLHTAEVTGRYRGILAVNDGSGALHITSNGEVTGESDAGILASNNHNGTDLIIHTAAVTAASRAIEAFNTGSGALTIVSSGALAGGLYGIFATQRGNGALSISTSEPVAGGFYGILALGDGDGPLSITSSGTVTGHRGAGIYALNGTGETTIIASEAVNGVDGYGIFSRHYGADQTIQTKAVTGRKSGISIVHNGDGALTLTTEGVVTGEVGPALHLNRVDPGLVNGTITNIGGLVSNQASAVLMTSSFNFEGDFDNNADITGGNGVAFDASVTSNGITLNQVAGTITGDVLLGSGDDRVTITGGRINGRIIGQGAGTVIIDIGADNVFSGNGVVNVADYVIHSGTVHQVGDFSTAAATTTIASGATLSFDSVIYGGGALVSDGEMTFVLSPGANGELIQAGTVTLNGGSTITVNTRGLSPSLNDSFKLISADSIIDNGVVVMEGDTGSLLYDYEALITSNTVSLVTTVVDLGTISPLQNPSAFGDSMTAFVSGGGDNAVVEFLAGLDSGDVVGFEQAADVFSPSVSGAVSQGAREANDSAWRLINARTVGSETAVHDSEPPNGLWLQGYGGTTDQDEIDHVEGFDADTGGVAVGYDLDLYQWRVGAAFSAGKTDIDNDRFASDSIDIESNQFIVYGGYWQDQWYVNATASVAALDYDFKRNNLLAGEGPIESDTDGDLFGVSVGGGYEYTVSDTFLLTPQLSVRYTTLDVDDYTENGGLDLQVEYDGLDTLASELGVSASARYDAGDWQWEPTARLAWVHEYLGENEQVTARYAGQSYRQEGFDPDNDLASVGLGLLASNEHGVSVSLDYRGVFGSDFSSNQGWLNVRYEF